jgi:hypothetical protein
MICKSSFQLLVHQGVDGNRMDWIGRKDGAKPVKTNVGSPIISHSTNAVLVKEGSGLGVTLGNINLVVLMLLKLTWMFHLKNTDL